MKAKTRAAKPVTPPPPPPPPSGYDGYLFRDNSDATGQVPAPPPYNLSPDIVRSSTPIPNAQSALTTQASLGTLYDCDPTTGEDNYYYLRTLNGGAAAGATQLSLYYAPAQLILFPSGAWQKLSTATGGDSVSASADSGHYAVGAEPFVWDAPPLPPQSASFYSFIAQAGDSALVIDDWLDMGTLVTQNLGVGFHNVGIVSAAQSWESMVGLAIPASFTSSATLTLTVSSSGFDGCKLGIIASRFTAEGHAVILNPVQLSDGAAIGFQFPGDPGYEATFYVQCWNGGTPVAAGSTINLLVSCAVPEERLEEALSRNLLDSGYINHVAASVGVGPHPVMPLGSVTFLVGGSSE